MILCVSKSVPVNRIEVSHNFSRVVTKQLTNLGEISLADRLQQFVLADMRIIGSPRPALHTGGAQRGRRRSMTRSTTGRRRTASTRRS
jgi:hypothetical protein